MNEMSKEQRVELARELKRKHNCCQSVIMAYADKLNLTEEQILATSSAFGRGISGLGEVCGCVSGMAMVCGLTGHADQMKSLGEKFRASNGDLTCARLLAMGKKPCPDMVAEAVEMLYDVVK